MKDGNRVSGTDRKDCPFYECFDSILGTRAATEPPVLIESSESVIISTEDNGDSDDEGHGKPTVSLCKYQVYTIDVILGVQNSCTEYSPELLSIPEEHVEPAKPEGAAGSKDDAEMHLPKKGTIIIKNN